jgi:hypothetical protein
MTPPAGQFRVLYRQFLFRLMDVEMLSASAREDGSVLLGQLGTILITISGFLSWTAFLVGVGVRGQPTLSLIWPVERFTISLTMLVAGIFALLSWDSLFPDRRDVLVLAPLPIRTRTLLAAKIAAAASALALTVAALNCLSAFAWPMMVGPRGSGFLGTARFAAAFWVALLAAGAFVYCVVLGLQAVAAQLPRRWYLRISSAMQIAVFILFLGVFLLSPSFSDPAALTAPANQRTLDWLPPYWFLGLLSELSGVFPRQAHAAMAPLAYRAIAGLPIAILAAAGAFLLSYLRTLRKIVEEPDVAPGSRGSLWLPRFGDPPQTALAQFVLRTLLRSRRHRVILAFYLGGGFAIVCVYLAFMRKLLRLTGIDMLHSVNVPMLVVTMLLLGASALGTRAVFSMPVDLRANWLFRVLPMPESQNRLAAVRRAFLTLSVFPMVALSAGLLLWYWPWRPAAGHLLVLAMVGSLLADVFLRGFRKIPFTCSYLPGRSKAHLVFWAGVVPVVGFLDRVMKVERSALGSPLLYASVGAAAWWARRMTDRSARDGEQEIQFEETPPDETIVLGL